MSAPRTSNRRQERRLTSILPITNHHQALRNHRKLLPVPNTFHLSFVLPRSSMPKLLLNPMQRKVYVSTRRKYRRQERCAHLCGHPRPRINLIIAMSALEHRGASDLSLTILESGDSGPSSSCLRCPPSLVFDVCLLLRCPHSPSMSASSCLRCLPPPAFDVRLLLRCFLHHPSRRPAKPRHPTQVSARARHRELGKEDW